MLSGADYTTAWTCVKNSPNSPANTSKMYWSKNGLKSGGMKAKNTRSRWAYPSKLVGSLTIIQTELTVDPSDRGDFLNEIMILVQMRIVGWKIDEK